jgi:protoporphyrinogen oxidase
MGVCKQGESVMPGNNRIVKQDLQNALEPAELRIVQFQPQSVTIRPNNTEPNPNITVDIPAIQQQFAHQIAQERIDALFDVLIELIRQGAADEISGQQIIQRLSNLERRITSLESGTVRSGSI